METLQIPAVSETVEPPALPRTPLVRMRAMLAKLLQKKEIGKEEAAAVMKSLDSLN